MLLWVVVLLLAAAGTQGQKSSPLIKIGSTYYMPLYKINDLEIAATIGSRQLLQGGYSSVQTSRGYDSSPAPTKPTPTRKYPAVPTTQAAIPTKGGYDYKPASTRLPPLAEQTPTSPDDAEIETNAPDAVSPEREAVLPTTPDPIGLEFEQEIESTAVEAQRPRPVSDTPDFEINEDEYGGKIPGVPGRDYPIHSVVPRTSFRCSDYTYSGYFGDIEARCQSFHVCLRQTSRSAPQKWSFLCPNGTIFNQRSYACSWWHEAGSCNDSPNLYPLNADVNWEDVTERTMKRIIQSQTGVFGDVASKLLQVERSQASKSSKSKSLTTGKIKKSESEAYEDKSIGASGFIVNRRPTKLDVAKKPSFSSKTPAGVRNPNGQTIPNTPPHSVYGPPGHIAPEPTYLPPVTTKVPKLTYLPPRTTPAPGFEIDQDALDPEETDQAPPPSKPEVGFETTTVVPITKPKPKLNYLPPRPYLPPGTDAAPTFRSKNGNTISQILATSNIVDNLSDNQAFQGFSNLALGTKSQLFNSNIRELLRTNRVQEIRPGFLDLEKTPISADGVEPLKAFLSSQGPLNDKQRVEIHEFDQMALFVPQESQQAGGQSKFPYVQPQAFPVAQRQQQPQPVVLQAAAKSLLQGAPIVHPAFSQVVSQAQVTYAAPTAPAPLRQPQPVQLPRQPLLIPQQSVQPVTRLQQFILTPSQSTQQQQPTQGYRQVFNNRPQQHVAYSAPQQQVGQTFVGELVRAQSYALPTQQHPFISKSRDLSSQPSIRRPLIEPTDQPEIIPSITIHSSTIVSRSRNAGGHVGFGRGLQGGYPGPVGSGSVNSVSLLKPATHFSKTKFYNKLTPKYENSGYNANRPLAKYIPASALNQNLVTFDRFRLVPQPTTQKTFYDSRTTFSSSTPKPVWTDYRPSHTAQSVTPARGYARTPVQPKRVAQGSSSAYGFRHYVNRA